MFATIFFVLIQQPITAKVTSDFESKFLENEANPELMDDLLILELPLCRVLYRYCERGSWTILISVGNIELAIGDDFRNHSEEKWDFLNT